METAHARTHTNSRVRAGLSTGFSDALMLGETDGSCAVAQIVRAHCGTQDSHTRARTRARAHTHTRS